MKALCKLNKKDREVVLSFDSKPKFKCKKCKREASKQKMLCKPKELK